MSGRVQLALNVNDIDQAVEFYSKLFGAAVQLRPGYANFAIADPPLKLVLLENPGQGGSLNHLGIEVPDTGAVDAEQARLSAAGLVSVDQRDTTCCYARQDKFWVQGAPDGEGWEIYTVLADSKDFYDHDHGGPGCCDARLRRRRRRRACRVRVRVLLNWGRHHARLVASREPDTASGRRRAYPGWRMVWALAVTETISYGVLYYSFAAFLLPMQHSLGFSQATLTGAFSLSVLLTGVGAVPAGAWLDCCGARGLMTAGSLLGAGCVVVWARAGDVAGLYLAFAGIGLAGAAVQYSRRSLPSTPTSTPSVARPCSPSRWWPGSPPPSFCLPLPC